MHFFSSQVSFFLFIIFTVYTMLPVGMQEAVGAGLVSSLSHILVLGVYLLLGQDSRAELALQVTLACPLTLSNTTAVNGVAGHDFS